jgi:hypothetical protein
MNRALKITRVAWFALAISLAASGAVWFATHRWPAARPTDNAELTALLNQREQLRPNDDATRDSLRHEQQGISRQAWNRERLAALVRRLSPDWRWEWEAGNRPARVSLVQEAPQMEEWPRYVALVTDLTRQPGTVLEPVEIEATGPARERRFTRVVIGLRFIIADAPTSDAERVAPSRGPLPVAPAESPATPRKIVPVSLLRLPSASAEPPAPGQASAPFRSDPPGPRAGVLPSDKSTNP